MSQTTIATQTADSYSNVAWSHIYLGEIFDMTGQRNRAVQEYHRAAQIGDDTEGAQALIAHRLNQAATADDVRPQGILVPYLFPK